MDKGAGARLGMACIYTAVLPSQPIDKMQLLLKDKANRAVLKKCFAAGRIALILMLLLPAHAVLH